MIVFFCNENLYGKMVFILEKVPRTSVTIMSTNANQQCSRKSLDMSDISDG